MPIPGHLLRGGGCCSGFRRRLWVGFHLPLECLDLLLGLKQLLPDGERLLDFLHQESVLFPDLHLLYNQPAREDQQEYQSDPDVPKPFVGKADLFLLLLDEPVLFLQLIDGVQFLGGLLLLLVMQNLQLIVHLPRGFIEPDGICIVDRICSTGCSP